MKTKFTAEKLKSLCINIYCKKVSSYIIWNYKKNHHFYALISGVILVNQPTGSLSSGESNTNVNKISMNSYSVFESHPRPAVLPNP